MKAGFAQIDISPSTSVELSGFAMREQASTGILDPLFARALYLEEDTRRFLWVHCDLIGFNEEIVLSFRAWASEVLGLDSSQVMLSATHTHSGPATVFLRSAGAYDPAYLQQLTKGLRSVAGQAFAGTEECGLVSVEGIFDSAVHRGGAATAHCDSRFHAVGLKRADGGYAALIANYAIHPVALGHQNRKVSGDLLGAAARELTERLPGRPLVLMTNGACGNLNPPKVNIDWNAVQAWGASFATALVTALEKAKPCQDRPLRYSRTLVPLSLDWLNSEGIDAFVRKTFETIPDKGFGARVRACVYDWAIERKLALAQGCAPRQRNAELHLLGLGDVIFVGANAELFSRFGSLVNGASGLSKTCAVGYVNGDMGYICTREAYAEGGYEVDMAHIFYGGFRFQTGGLEYLAGIASALVRQLDESNQRGS